MDTAHIRNFSIIAHIDHGKTTLSDRLLHRTGTITTREMEDQLLDSMDLEKERGITIKAHPVTMLYQAGNGETYELNLIDTPGHVDFSYEVSRSLSACEGALLIVDAAQGVEAQTVANVHLAMKQNLAIIPVINKIDLPHADVAQAKRQLEDILAIAGDSAILASAKEGIGIEQILEAIVERIPAPKPTGAPSLQALGFDCYFDTYRGVVTHVRVFNGELKPGMQVKLLHSGKNVEVKEVGSFNPKPYVRERLECGETGYMTANIKSPLEVKMGDTITDARHPAPALPGFKEIHPMVFSGIYPINTGDYEHLKANLAKLQLNDSAFVYQPETSVALGFGFRCGFLGLLHLEIVQERLRREYNMDIIATYPSVIYRVKLTDGTEVQIDNPAYLPPVAQIESISEPMVRAFVICPNEYIGDMMALITEKRGAVDHTETLDSRRVMLTSLLPLNEILIDFHDRIKSITHGYGSMDYEPADYQASNMVKLDLLVNGEAVDAFSCIVHRDKAEGRGRALAARLKEVIPRQLYAVAIQAAIGGKIIARETVSALRKDVTAKCYGGDITRKRKLLEKQKEGKKRMKSFGSVNIPQEAFIEVLKA
ncbi:MAG TPA: translation elongation factor 4 [Candidatus Paceibacterota bacterium]|jgi:GTP-binding protein LepA|nr:elongation factor 4 [Limisphaerales bacterium]HOW79056.1 translation elongation factor 4 [Verrucomicrobiota bacterium]HRY58674.1 translation elongation factor 4 [Candidatus Paceibacterota bacterium]HQE89880.1 translation elongation factor 4 [Verrucomicrobiota bacterium]HQJ50066.1 translation elongation factor 4 [Verrucomicrobiota bacterium]